MPLPDRGPSPPPLAARAGVNFKGNFEEWSPGFSGMIVAGKGWNVIRGMIRGIRRAFLRRRLQVIMKESRV